MRVEVRRQKQYKTSGWSGGSTTELYLYPEDGDYAKRDFKIRVSSAAVETEESHFTSLPGVRRNLMILEGEMKLVHNGTNAREMKPYDIDTFLGSWDTVSYGKVRDFNLMVQGDTEGAMYVYRVKEERKLSWPMGNGGQKVMLYVAEGKGELNGQEADRFELIVLHGYHGEECTVKNTGREDLVLAVCTCCGPSIEQ